jgi:hypothetical protein
MNLFGFLDAQLGLQQSGQEIERALPPQIQPRGLGRRSKARLASPPCSECHVNLSKGVCRNRMCRRFGEEQR